MKTINEMKETVKNFLEENGLVKDDYFRDDVYYIPEKVKVTSEIVTAYTGEQREWKTVKGLIVRVRETYRNNGTNENQSIYIEVERAEGSSSHIILREKLYSKHGAKKTATVLQNVLNAYNA